jgi:hypothetical protein
MTRRPKHASGDRPMRVLADDQAVLDAGEQRAHAMLISASRHGGEFVLGRPTAFRRRCRSSRFR